MLRAAHLVVDGEPPVLNDTVVARLLGGDVEARIRAHADELQTPDSRGLRSAVVLRSRFAEDALMDAVEEGVEQYVLLGAGLDTFAYRQPPWARRLTIIEVDHPASQAAKRAALAAAGIEIPPNVRFADVDFERETLSQGLARCGVDTAKRTFFSWKAPHASNVSASKAAFDAYGGRARTGRRVREARARGARRTDPGAAARPVRPRNPCTARAARPQPAVETAPAREEPG